MCVYAQTLACSEFLSVLFISAPLLFRENSQNLSFKCDFLLLINGENSSIEFLYVYSLCVRNILFLLRDMLCC